MTSPKDRGLEKILEKYWKENYEVWEGDDGVPIKLIELTKTQFRNALKEAALYGSRDTIKKLTEALELHPDCKVKVVQENYIIFEMPSLWQRIKEKLHGRHNDGKS